MSNALQTPVSIFFYRRPDHLRQVMAKIREARPMVLFGISDGSKTGNGEIRRGVEESRKVFREMIDWPCQWELLERPVNVGSFLSVSGGLDWVFERVGETIVLEDDTVPDLSFFRFTAELLEKYRADSKVGAICGNNYDDPKDWLGDASYRFTRYHHSWGWGTWKRAWQYFDREEKLLAEVPKLRKENWMKLSRSEWIYWERCFERTYARKLDAWDYRWTLSLWKQHMSCIIPKVNLVRNIGFDAQATHTVEHNFAQLKMHEIQPMIFPLNQPPLGTFEVRLDDRVFRNHYQKLEGRRGFLKKFLDAQKKVFFTNKTILHVLDDITLVAVATTKNNETVAALNYSCRRLKFGNVILFTDKPNKKNKDLTQIYVPPFSSVTDWGRFIIFDLHVFIKTKYIILIHYDGFIINPDQWTNEFYQYDFIGAPWPVPGNLVDYRTKNGKIIRVGNSVSLRSKRILELPSQLGVMWPSKNKEIIHEDGFLCIELRDLLAKHGVKYAPLHLACRFSRETSLPENKNIKPFAFHKWNDENKKCPLNPKKNITKVYFYFSRLKP